MIYITGDTHGDYSRFSMDNFPEQKNLNKDDYVIVCGDFGYWHDTPEERHNLKQLKDRPFTTLFVDGNHENYDRLYDLPVKEWNGGQVHFINDSVIHLMRGQVFTIDGKKFFTMGGASSHDINAGVLEQDDPDFKKKRKELDRKQALYRINHLSWWAEELPSIEEYNIALRNLDVHNWDVNFIISHCCPSSVQDILSNGFYQKDALTNFFDEVKERCKFDYWCFGHYHDNRQISKKYVLLYEQIIPIM